VEVPSFQEVVLQHQEASLVVAEEDHEEVHPLEAFHVHLQVPLLEVRGHQHLALGLADLNHIH
jgi:hypothetical protein